MPGAGVGRQLERTAILQLADWVLVVHLIAMSRRKLILLFATGMLIAFATLPGYRLTMFLSLYPQQYRSVGKPSYQIARTAADRLMSSGTDGPWEYAKDRFILDFDGTLAGKPKWVFRYLNKATGQKSVRIYVDAGESVAYYHQGVLDPLPLHGRIP